MWRGRVGIANYLAKTICPMHARIYFLIAILTSVIIANFKDDEISALTAENEELKQSFETHKSAAGSNQLASSDHFGISADYTPVASEARIMFSVPAGNNDEEGSLASYREKIGLMESHLKRYRHDALGYQMMIDALKNEINLKDDELHQLRTSITNFQLENRMITEALTRKEDEMNEALALLNNRDKEAILEEKIQDLARDLRLAEADACYARAQLTEIAGDKIFFSPARKKEYFREALEGYKKALSLGKLAALHDISRLQKTLFPEFAAAH